MDNPWFKSIMTPVDGSFQAFGGMPGQFLVLFLDLQNSGDRIAFFVDGGGGGESKNLRAVGEVSENLPG